MGALHGTAWIPKSWLDNLENNNDISFSENEETRDFFNAAAIEAALAGDASSNSSSMAAGGERQQQELVHMTRDMGRDAAVTLAKLLAKLDCRQ